MGAPLDGMKSGSNVSEGRTAEAVCYRKVAACAKRRLPRGHFEGRAWAYPEDISRRMDDKTLPA